MKQVAENLYARGKSGKLYCRIRIPSKLKAAYPRQSHITRALGTSDRREGRALLIAELAAIQREFAHKEQQLAVKAAQRAARSVRRLTALTEQQVQNMAGNWVHQTLVSDDEERIAGLDDEDFQRLDDQLRQQRQELGRLLAQGKVEPILPVMHSFFYMLGANVDLAPEQQRKVAYKLLESMVQAIDIRLERQSGRVKPTADLAPATNIDDFKKSISRSGPTWAEVFEKWVKHVDDRPKPTVIAAQTPWRELERVARAAGINAPGQVTKALVNQFVEGMAERGLATDTINERLAKVKAVYKVAVGRLLLKENPAQDVIGRGKSAREKRRKKRLPFDQSDLNTIFSCSIYNGEQRRSRGSSKEASYWIPLLMYYTGARTEEVAGLAVEDLVYDDSLGCWYLNLIDRPEPDDAELFDEDEDEREDESEEAVKVEAHGRTLKNAASIRRVPVAQELLDLGLLRYVAWVKSKGAKALFPTLKKDFHGKLSGSFSKFFGRLKLKLAINDKRKVLYSFRHTMKDTLEAAEVPSRYLKRLMGHTSGDGAITDKYGSDLPFDVLVRHFKAVKFRPIPAVPWEPGKGYVDFPHLRAGKKSKTAQKRSSEPRS